MRCLVQFLKHYLSGKKRGTNSVSHENRDSMSQLIIETPPCLPHTKHILVKSCLSNAKEIAYTPNFHFGNIKSNITSKIFENLMLSLKCRHVAILVFFGGWVGLILFRLTLRDWPWAPHSTCQVAGMCIAVHELTPSHVALHLQVSSTSQRRCAEDHAINAQVSGGCLSKWSWMGLRAIARTRDHTPMLLTHSFIYCFLPSSPISP